MGSKYSTLVLFVIDVLFLFQNVKLYFRLNSGLCKVKDFDILCLYACVCIMCIRVYTCAHQ